MTIGTILRSTLPAADDARVGITPGVCRRRHATAADEPPTMSRKTG